MDKKTAEKYLEKFEKELYGSVEPFWTNYGMDKKHGGITTCLDRYGKVYSTDKGVWQQGRAAYMYSLLYKKHKDRTNYREAALSCLNFLEKYCISGDGRMYFTVTKEGLPLRKRRYYFSETFYIIACAEYYAATGEKEYLDRAVKYYDFVLKIYRGEIADPFYMPPKTIPETRRTFSFGEPMILLNVTHVLKNADSANAARYNAEAKSLLNDIFRRFYHDDSGLITETAAADGKPDMNVAAYRIVNPGHSLEASWFIYNESIYSGDKTIAEKAEKIFAAALNIGWDKEYGGIFYFKDIEGKPIEAYEHDMKLWWPHNEAIIASLLMYKNTGKKEYEDWFYKLCDYAFSAFSDPAYGEWFGYLRRDGKPTEPPCKGHTYKGFFHVARMLDTCIELLKDITNGQ